MDVELGDEFCDSNACQRLSDHSETTSNRHDEGKQRRQSRWEDYKDKIYHLYIEEGMELQEVARVMAETHDFQMAAATYKNYFARWKWRKYIEGDDVGDLAVQIQSHIQAGTAVVPSIHDKTDQELQKIQRTIGRKKQFPEAQAWISKLLQDRRRKGKQVRRSRPVPPQSQALTPIRMVSPNGSRNAGSSPAMNHFGGGSLEILLFETRNYLDHHINKIRLSPSSMIKAGSFEGDQFNQLLLLILQGCQYLSLKPTAHGLDLICKGRDMAESALLQQNITLPKLMVRLFAHRRWRLLPGMRESILGFLNSMSRRKLGPLHPITTIFQQLRCSETTMDARLPLLRVMLDVMKQGPSPNSLEVHDVQMDLVDSLMLQQDIDEALELCERLITDYSNRYGRNFYRTIDVKAKLGRLYYAQGRDAEAVDVWLEVVRQGAAREGRMGVYALTIHTCEDLAKLYQDQEEYCLSETYWRQALRWSVVEYGIMDVSTLGYFKGLFNILMLKGDLVEAQDLKEEFPDLAAYLKSDS